MYRLQQDTIKHEIGQKLETNMHALPMVASECALEKVNLQWTVAFNASFNIWGLEAFFFFFFPLKVWGLEAEGVNKWHAY